MKKSKFTDQQTDFALKQAETGTPIEEVCRKLGISQQTFLSLAEKVRGAWDRRAPTPETT